MNNSNGETVGNQKGEKHTCLWISACLFPRLFVLDEVLAQSYIKRLLDSACADVQALTCNAVSAQLCLLLGQITSAQACLWLEISYTSEVCVGWSFWLGPVLASVPTGHLYVRPLDLGIWKCMRWHCSEDA